MVPEEVLVCTWEVENDVYGFIVWGGGVLGFIQLAYWRTGVLAYWHTGVLAYWRTGILAYWHTGILVYWRTGILAY